MLIVEPHVPINVVLASVIPAMGLAVIRFLIIDSPNDANVESYIREFKKHNVVDVVRACDPSYDREKVEREGVHVHDLAFPDGDPPPAAVIDGFLRLCHER